MLKKSVQQGRSERPVTATFPIGGCPRQISGQAPSRTTEPVPTEPPSDARTMHGKRRVSARLGRAGAKVDFFSILLAEISPLKNETGCEEYYSRVGCAIGDNQQQVRAADFEVMNDMTL